jgi:hypothetical protein
MTGIAVMASGLRHRAADEGSWKHSEYSAKAKNLSMPTAATTDSANFSPKPRITPKAKLLLPRTP